MARVLLTNDDGISSPGLLATRQALADAGLQVLVVAPDGNRSAMGHRINIRSELTLRLERSDEVGEMWSCSGTPADCVRMAYFTADLPEFDAVVSGMNLGPNLGEDVFYSGTVAAAIEGALLGKPAIAASQASGHLPESFLALAPTELPHARFVADLAKRILTASASLEGVILNVNLPSTLERGVDAAYARLGRRDWTTTGNTTSRDGDTITVSRPWIAEPIALVEEGTDFHVVLSDRISVTPLRVRSGLEDLSASWREHAPLSITPESVDLV